MKHKRLMCVQMITDIKVYISYYMDNCGNSRANICNQALTSGRGVFIRDMCCNNHLPERRLWYADFSKAFSRLSSSGDYKRTQQGALTALLPYLYKLQVVHATTMCLSYVYSTVTVQDYVSYPNIHMSYMW